MVSENPIATGRTGDIEEYFGIRLKTGPAVMLKIFNGTYVTDMTLEIAEIPDEK